MGFSEASVIFFIIIKCCLCFIVLNNSTMKVIESYKDNDPNYTMRRQMELEQGEAKQLDCLRRVRLNSLTTQMVMEAQISS